MAKFLCHATINVNFFPGKKILIEKKPLLLHGEGVLDHHTTHNNIAGTNRRFPPPLDVLYSV